MADTTRPRSRRVEGGGGGRPPDPTVDKAGLHLPIPGRWEVPIEVWAAFVRYARRHRDMSQAELAGASGVTQQTISKVETADICPHDRLKSRLAEALDVPTAVLFPWPTDLVRTPAGGFAWPTLPGPPAEGTDA